MRHAGSDHSREVFLNKIGFGSRIVRMNVLVADHDLDRSDQTALKTCVLQDRLDQISGGSLAFGAGYHHERLDGKGYPRGLHGDEIPEVARLIAVADTFDAMYSTRPYRKQMLLTDVMDELKRVAGTQLEAEVVEALVELANENKLNKDEVDRHIKENIYGLHEEKEKEKHEHKEKIKKQNSDFIKSLGLGKDDD